MIIVGERINTSRKPIAAMVESRNEQQIVNEAKRQIEAGATYIDVNAGTFVDNEAELLQWMCRLLEAELSAPLCIGSSDPRSIEAALAVCTKETMINSITCEQSRFDAVCSLALEHGSAVIALCIDDSGMPGTVTDTVAIGSRLVDKLTARGMSPDRIYLDPLVRAASTEDGAARITIDSIAELQRSLPDVHTICGLSNLGYGLPARAVLNRAFLVATVTAGMDAAILDPLDSDLMAMLTAALLIAGRDKHCKNYIKAYRAGKLG